MSSITQRLNKVFGSTCEELDFTLPKSEHQLTCWHDSKWQTRWGKKNGMYGHVWTKESLKKISDKAKGKIKRMFKWEITTPDGETIVRNNIAQFCRENIGPNSWQNLIARGKHLGYTAKKLGRA